MSQVSAIPAVRRKLVAMQQEMGRRRGVVMDGRDIGTVVFPDAELKIFMTADPRVRACRRYDELRAKGDQVSLEEIERNVRERDKADMGRAISPLRQTASPYRRFVFWISQEYCNHLLQISKDYAYLMQHVQVSQNYFFPTDRITFNAIQSKLLRLIEEVRSDRFGRDAQIPLYVNDLLLYLNRLVYERLHPQKSRTEESLYQNVAAYIEEHLDEDLSLEKLAGEFFVSKYHIAHVFKDNLGLSIHQYITKKRLALCREAILGQMSSSLPLFESFVIMR